MQIPTDLILAPRDIETRGVLRSDVTNTIRSRVGILLSIYFLEGWRREKRQALMDCLGDYLARFGNHVTHFQTHGVRGYKRWDGNGLPPPLRDEAAIYDEGEDLYYSMRHLEAPETDDPDLYRILAFGFKKGDRRRPLSGLKAHIPPSYVFADPDRFAELVRVWSERLGAVHGSAGLGVLSTPGSETTEDAYYYPWLIQYPALEYDAMGNYWVESEEGGYERPRSSNWLTILGHDNIVALGGVGTILRALTPEMRLEHFPGGVVIRASPLPALGNPETGGIPEGYRVAARIIKPIRFEGYKFSIIKLPPHLNTGREARLAETLKWLRRFD